MFFRAKRPRDVWLIMEPAFLNQHPGLKALNAELTKPTAAILSTNADWMLSFVKKSLPQVWNYIRLVMWFYSMKIPSSKAYRSGLGLSVCSVALCSCRRTIKTCSCCVLDLGGYWQVHISIDSSPWSTEVKFGRKQRCRWWGRCLALRITEEPSNLKNVVFPGFSSIRDEAPKVPIFRRSLGWFWVGSL